MAPVPPEQLGVSVTTVFGVGAAGAALIVQRSDWQVSVKVPPLCEIPKLAQLLSVNVRVAAEVGVATSKTVAVAKLAKSARKNDFDMRCSQLDESGGAIHPARSANNIRSIL